MSKWITGESTKFLTTVMKGPTGVGKNHILFFAFPEATHRLSHMLAPLKRHNQGQKSQYLVSSFKLQTS